MATKVSAEDFVKVWQSAENVDEVVAATGLTRGSACVRASRYRKMGIALKRFRGVDWGELAEVAGDSRKSDE